MHGHACKHKTWIKVTDIYKHSSLLRYEINYDRKNSYIANPLALCYKSFLGEIRNFDQ